MKKHIKLLTVLLAVLMVLTSCGSQENPGKTPEPANTAFEPKLDTEKAVELNAAVFFGNFEALDQVINHFNEFYPNVKIYYEQKFTHTPNFLQENPYIDIFMTSNEKGYPADGCLDLLAAGVDTSAVEESLLRAGMKDGKLLSLPMGLTLKGIVVNKTLLEKEGLSVPQTWAEFLNTLETLKQKGYTPIQGPDSAVSTLGYNMGMAMLASDPDLLNAVSNGDVDGAAQLQLVYDRMQELIEKGYISQEVNAEYPNDNYDGAILKFFEGDVPFWVCDTEKVSGMKKREAKSEAFSANPFDYEFIFAPFGDNGVYEYVEPWYGFAVNKDSERCDYAVEFLRFMARQEELNTLASIKGVPSVAKNSDDTRYVNLSKVEKIEKSVVSDGSVLPFYGTYLSSAAAQQLAGEVNNAEEAVAAFVSRCAETVQDMQNETEANNN